MSPFTRKLSNSIFEKRMIMDLFLETEFQPLSRVYKQCWEKSCLDLVGAWVAAERVEDAE